MILSERNIDIWYKAYVAQYKGTTQYAKRLGGTLRESKMYTRDKFRYLFLTEIDNGTKLVGKKLAQTMAKDQLYLLSHRQAETRAKAVSKYRGTKFSLNAIMMQRLMADPSEDLWSAVREREAEYKEFGFSLLQVDMFIGQDFFSSK